MYKLLLCLLLVSCVSTPKQSMDSWIRDRIVKLTSEQGSCSGVQVITPSRHVYILTAKHCEVLDNAGYIIASGEHGNSQPVKILSKSDKLDLMLLAPFSDRGIEIAESTRRHEHVWTMTHGMSLDSYRTDGELVQMSVVTVTDSITERVMITTAHVEPGSSGGPALNDKGELVGIVSISMGGYFGGLVPLIDIKSFLADK